MGGLPQELNQIKSDIVQQAAPILYNQIGNFTYKINPKRSKQQYMAL